MVKAIKQMMAEEVRAELEGSANVLVIGLGPMGAEATVEFRDDLRAQGAHMRVIHNRTSRHALDDERQGLAQYFTGQTALMLAPGDEPDMVAIAKIAVESAKKKHVEARAGFVDGELLDAEGFDRLSKSPDKKTLRGMLAGTIVAPGRGILTCVDAVLAGLARCLRQRSESAEGSEGEGEGDSGSDGESGEATAAPEAAE